MDISYDVYNSEIGYVYVILKDNKIIKIDIGKENFDKSCDNYRKKYKLEIIRDEKKLSHVIKQIDEYFKGERNDFELEFDILGTDFQKSVYREMIKIPYGETRSYSEIAQNIGNIKAVRAVGQASKANDIPIIIPCHRVVGKNNKLGGYMGNHSNLKEILLNIEKNI